MNKSMLSFLRFVHPLLCVALGALALGIGAQGQLPDSLATHWNLGGQVTQCMSTPWFLRIAFLLVLGLSVSQSIAFAGLLGKDEHARARWQIHLATVNSLLCGLLMATLYMNYGSTRCEESELSYLAVALSLLPAIGLRRYLRRLEVRHEPSAAPSIGLSPQERAVWIGRARSKPLLWLALVVPLFALLGAQLGYSGGIWVPLLACVATLSLASIRVQASARGVEVYYGPWPIALTKISLDEIRSASAETLDPRLAGGWGYRGSLGLTGRATVFLRSGECLSLELTRDRRFRVSVDDASQAAALLSDLIRHRQE